MTSVEDDKVASVYNVVPRFARSAAIRSEIEYKQLYEKSLINGDEFWAEIANKYISWFSPFTSTRTGDFESGDVSWFPNGKLNACYNCVDRHVAKNPDKIAIVYEGDEPNHIQRITFAEMLRAICRIANALKRYGVRKGDTVCIYMPMVPETVFSMLACARIGASHNVVFAGFSMDSIASRIMDAHCKVVITATEGVRAGKKVPLKTVIDEAVAKCPCVEHVFVHHPVGTTSGNFTPFNKFDIHLQKAMMNEEPLCPIEPMDSSETLFILYTSGSSGTPKGLAHTHGGYLVYASLTHRYAFDLKPDDVYACVADVGWITGHTYIVYGPLANGCATLLFESTPLYPDVNRYWDMIQRHRISIFYTSPTAVRSLMKANSNPKKFDLSSLRVIGTVGEHINPAAWRWLFEDVGNRRCPIVDTYWQTETGGVILTPFAGATQMKPGSAAVPFFGIEPVILDPSTGIELKNNGVEGVLAVKRPWPGLARSIFGNHQRFMNSYLLPYPGYYFTGDGAKRDKDGYLWITGRVDDVVNVSGHRIGSAEVEHCIVGFSGVAESAVCGIPHPIKGSSLFAFVVLKDTQALAHSEGKSLQLVNNLKGHIKSHLGGISIPDDILIVEGLPKTRSGKIMRRMLRAIAMGETSNFGDTSTLNDPSVVDKLVKQVKQYHTQFKQISAKL